MTAPILLHVGTMKSGTSYLQRRLDENRAALDRQGLLFPGKSWGQQVHAVGDLLGRGRLGGDSEKRSGAWLRLVDEILAHPGPAIVSVELLGAAAPSKLEAALASFGDRDVRVLITARDLNRNLLAMWQEGLQNGRTIDWPDFVREVREGTGAGGRFWREQDVPRMVRRWADQVGRDHVTVVTVPPPGADPEALWRRFCSVVGMAPESCSPVAPANGSLGAGSATVLLRLNRILAEADLSWRDYNVLVKRALAKGVLAGRRAEEPALGLPVARWVRNRSREMCATLDSLGVEVVGDLADLKPVGVPGVRPGSASAQDQVDAAVLALAVLVRRGVVVDQPVDEEEQVERVLEGAHA
jgi:hypothetical protein